jgi:hypothetical protein
LIRRLGQSTSEFLAALAGPALGLSAANIDSFLRGADALDMVEFLRELGITTRLRDPRYEP